MELYRKELKLAVIKGLDESRGSSNVPIKLTHDTSDEYINYTEQIHIRYLFDNQLKEEILPTNDNGFYIPGKPLSHDGPIELAVHLINGDIELVTNELSFVVKNAPNGTTQVDPSEFTWQQLVDQYVNAKLDTFANKLDLSKFEETVNGSIENQNQNIESFKTEVNANLSNQDKKITDLQNTTKVSLDSQNTKIDNFKSKVNTSLSNQNTSINQTTSAQNSKITTLESRMDTFTRLSEGSTTGDAELKDIRVGANGVTYNTAGDAVRGQYSQLKEDLVEYGNIFKRVNLFNKDKIHDGVINNQNTDSPYGSFTTLDGYFASELIEAIPGDKLFVWGSFDKPFTSYVTFYSSKKKVVSSVNAIGVHTIVPDNAMYFSVSSSKTKLDTLMAYNEQPTKYYSYDYVRSNDDKVKCVKVNLFNGEFVRDFYCDENLADLRSLENAVTSLPIVVHGETHVSYRNDGANGFNLYFYGEDYNKISDVWCAKNTKGTIPVPENAFYIRLYALNELSDITLVYGDVVPERKYLPNEISLCIKEVEDLKQSMSNYSNFLDGKKIVFDGDSITEGAGVTDVSQGIAPNNNKGYGYWIQQNHPTSICYGYAKSGWKVARRTDSNDSLLSHIEQYPADVDCFVLSGGYNDQATQVAIGEIVEPTDGSNAYFNATFDEYTFIGALESWFKQLRKNYPNAKIVYVLTPKRIYATNTVFDNDSKGDKVKDVIYSTGYERINLFWDSIKKVCKKWSVKYLDLSENCGIVGTGELTGDGLDVNKRYYKLDTDGNPDFTHPNTLFYKTFIVPQIENLLKSVLD